MNQILLIEDDPVLSKGLTVNLELEGYRVFWGPDLATARMEFERNPINLIILDLSLPDGDGLEFCKSLKENQAKAQAKIPIIILTAKIDENSVVAGLNSGASDYVKKPFSIRELMARIRVGLRDLGNYPDREEDRPKKTVFGPISLLHDQRKVLVENREIKFNRREFDILNYLAQKAEVIVTRDNLLEGINRSDSIFDRTIDSHLSHIRSKLKSAGVTSVKITSVYGVGYRLEQLQ